MASFAAGYYFGGMKHNIEFKEVDKTQTQELVRTTINERPDGSKSTVIEEKRAILAHREVVLKANRPPDWRIDLSRSFTPKPVHTLGISRRVLPGAFLGLSGATDGTISLTLGYEF